MCMQDSNRSHCWQYHLLLYNILCAALALAPQVVMQIALLQLTVHCKPHVHKKKAIPVDAETQS